MAEHTHSGPAELGAPMDYAEHERTFRGFVALTKIAILATIDTVLALALFAYGGGAGFWLGILLLLLMTVGVVIALMAKGALKPLLIVTIIGFVLFALSVG